MIRAEVSSGRSLPDSRFSTKVERPGLAAALTVSTGAAPPSRSRLERRGAHRDHPLGVGRLHRLDGVAGIDRPLERVGGDDLDDLGDLHDVEQRGHARHDVLAGGRRRRDDRVVGAGKLHDEGGQRFGQAVFQFVGIGQQHLGRALQLRGGIGRGLGALAGDQHMHVRADLQRGAQRLRRLVGQALIVVFGDEENCHSVSVNPSCRELRARRLRCASLSTSSATFFTLTPALRPPGSSVFTTFRLRLHVGAEIGRRSSRRAASSWPS